MKIYDLSIRKNSDYPKELDVISLKTNENIPDSYLKTDFKNWIPHGKESDINFKEDDYTIQNENKSNNEETQFGVFQKSMLYLLACGQFLGLNPVSGSLGRDISKMRFVTYSWKFSYSVVIAIFQTVAMSLCWYKLFTSHISVSTLGTISFYFSTWFTTIIFFRIATKWPNLVKAIFNCDLHEYIDLNLIKRVRIACVTFLLLALLEHLLSILSQISKVLNCLNYESSIYEEFIRESFPWLYSLDVPFNIPMAILILFLNIIVTLNWNYSDVIIICVSLYLSSILKEINKKIIWAVDMNFLSVSKWARLREDYTRASRIVKLFDEVFSVLILVSFANNLFFICLQLYNILTNGIHFQEIVAKKCLRNYEGFVGLSAYPIYISYSLLFLVLRFLTMSIIAADVNVASLTPAAALYRIPASAYNKEVQRFLDQIHGDTVAFSGLNFFYITRGLVLSVAGTIVTYELVLLQLRNDDFSET